MGHSLTITGDLPAIAGIPQAIGCRPTSDSGQTADTRVTDHRRQGLVVIGEVTHKICANL
jgi:hypothetical protein